MVRSGVVASIGVLFALVSSGCTEDGPTLSDVAPMFERDAPEIFEDLVERTARNPDGATIVDDGTSDVACADGQVKREFEGSFPIQDEPDLDDKLDLYTSVVWSELSRRSYEGNWPPNQADAVDLRELTTTNADETIRFTVRFAGKPTPSLTFLGETNCLRP
ncbi:MAG: hypothetical protein GEU93_18065 [Propionibacteriales bacterium]|nr:hypothetical protein [Propionibacteriales bacterium]